MKIQRSFIFTFFVAFILCFNAISQVTVNTVTVTTPPATECTTTFLTVSGTHNYGGYTYTGATVVVNGNILNVTLNYSFGIGIAVITPFSQNVDIGLIPAGAYTLNTNGTVNGTPYAPYTSSLTIQSCCNADPSFTSSQPSICVGDSVYFTNTSTGTTSQFWYKDGALLDNTFNWATVGGSAGPMVIKLLVSDGTCSDSVSLTVNVLNPPVVNSINVSALTACVGESVNFTSVSTGTFGSFGKVWKKDGVQVALGANYTENASGVGVHIYTFVGSNGACSDSDQVSIEYFAPAEILSFNILDSSICMGDSAFSSGTFNGATSMDWRVDDVNLGTGGNFGFLPNVAGSYVIELLVSNANCADSMEGTVIVSALPTINLGPDTNSCSGPVILDAGAGFTYLWSDASTAQTLSVNTAGTYFVTVTDINGCIGSDTIVLTPCLSIDNVVKLKLNVFPNPSTGLIYIDFGKNFSDVFISVLNISGREVLRYESHNTSSLNLNLSEIARGVYFLKIAVEGHAQLVKIVLD